MTVAFRSIGATATGTAVSSITVDVPSGVVPGDMLVFIHASDGLTGPDDPAIPGWTRHSQNYNAGTASSSGVGLHYKIVTGTEPANYSVNYTAAGLCMGTIFAISRTTSDLVINTADTSGGSDRSSSTTTGVHQSISPSVANTLLVFAGTSNLASGTGGTHTQPTGMTERLDTSHNRISCWMDTEALASSGATGTRTTTISATSSYAANMMAVAEGANTTIYADCATATTTGHAADLTFGIDVAADLTNADAAADDPTVSIVNPGNATVNADPATATAQGEAADLGVFPIEATLATATAQAESATVTIVQDISVSADLTTATATGNSSTPIRMSGLHYSAQGSWNGTAGSTLSYDIPFATAVGDLLVLHIGYMVLPTRTLTTPSGWTLGSNTASGSGSTAVRHYIYWKVAEAGDAGGPTNVSVTASGVTEAVGGVTLYKPDSYETTISAETWSHNLGGLTNLSINIQAPHSGGLVHAAWSIRGQYDFVDVSGTGLTIIDDYESSNASILDTYIQEPSNGSRTLSNSPPLSFDAAGMKFFSTLTTSVSNDAPCATATAQGHAPDIRLTPDVQHVDVSADLTTVTAQGESATITATVYVSISADLATAVSDGAELNVITDNTLVSQEELNADAAAYDATITTVREVLQEVTNTGDASAGALEAEPVIGDYDIKYIAASYTGYTSTDAEILESLDFGALAHTQTKKARFRIGNTLSVSKNFRVHIISVNDELVPYVQLSLDNATYTDELTIENVPPNGVTDVIWVRFTPSETSLVGIGTFLIKVEIV